MAHNKVKVKLFGNLTLVNGNIVLSEQNLHSNKMIHLLAYLILNREIPVTSRRLAEQFWSVGSRNPESALKNLVYRLRGALKALGPEEYICTFPGAYQWNPEIPVETDYERFELLGEKIEAESDSVKKAELCAEAVACYCGNVSPRIAEEIWMLPKVIQYREQYMDAVKVLFTAFWEGGEWKKLEHLCQDVLVMEPLDEDAHCWLIRALQKQKKFDQAMAQYEEAKRLLYENFGIRTSEKLFQVSHGMALGQEEGLIDISGLYRDVCEAERPQGAFFCDYQIFRQIYRLEMRRMDRVGISEYILLLTVRRSGKLWTGVAADIAPAGAAEILEDVLKSSLRAGDVIARSGPAQYVVLLSGCTYEAGLAVAERVRKNFQKKVKKKKIELKYELGGGILPVEWHGGDKGMKETATFPVNMARLCIDGYGSDVSGRVYSKLTLAPLAFAGCCELLLRMDDLFEYVGYPQAFQERRSFRKETTIRGAHRNMPEKMPDDKELEQQYGACSTFDLVVESRRRSGWQGLLMNPGRTGVEYFRSEMELLDCLCRKLERAGQSISE